MAEEVEETDRTAEKTLAERLRDSALTPRAAAELIAKLARVVEAEHWQGRYGRLPPENVRIAADGSVRLAEETQVAAAPYAAPEQADESAEPNPTTDVYALGVLLYECLTGRPPYLGTTATETLKRARSSPLLPPRVLQPDLPRKLETICLKCLRKDPQQRYPSASALADDLQRYLEGRRIVARPAPLIPRAIAWARRNPAAAGWMTACVLGILLAAGVVANHYIERAAEDRARRAARERTVASFNQFAEEAIAAARAIAASNPQQASGVLKNAAAVYEDLVSEESTPETLAGLGRVLNASAEIHFELGLLDETLHAADKAMTVHRRLVAEQPRRLTFRAALAESFRQLGEIRLVRGDSAEATPAFREAEQILRGLISERPREPEYKHELSRVLGGLGTALWSAGHREEAAAAVEEAFTLASQSAGVPEAPPAWRRQLGFCHEKRGDVLFAYAETYAETEAALDEYRAALAIYEQLSERVISSLAGRIDLARVLTSLGEAQIQQDRPDAAREALDRASEIAQREADRRPEHSAWEQVLQRIREAKATADAKNTACEPAS